MTTTTSLVDLPRTILGSLTTIFTAPTSCAYLGVGYVGDDLVGWEGQVRTHYRLSTPPTRGGQSRQRNLSPRADEPAPPGITEVRRRRRRRPRGRPGVLAGHDRRRRVPEHAFLGLGVLLAGSGVPRRVQQRVHGDGERERGLAGAVLARSRRDSRGVLSEVSECE